MGKHSRKERAEQAELEAIAAELERHRQATRLAEGLQRAKERLKEREGER